MSAAKYIFRVYAVRKGKDLGFRPFVDIRFGLDQIMDTGECFPEHAGTAQEVVDSRFNRFRTTLGFNPTCKQYDRRQAITGLGL
jgi:hypothetical protein